MTALAAAAGRRHARPGPRLDVDLAAVAANTRLFARRATGRADGGGQGRRVRPRRRRRRPDRPGARRHLARRHQPRRGARAARRRARAPVLSWLNPVDADCAGRGRRAASSVAVPSASTSTRSLAPAPRRPGAPAPRHRDGPRRRRAAATGPALCRAARRAERAGPVARRRRDGPPRLRRRPGRPGQRARPDPVRLGPRRPPARPGCDPPHRHLAATAATLTDPLSHHTMCRVGAGLVGIDPSGTTDAARRR